MYFMSHYIYRIIHNKKQPLDFTLSEFKVSNSVETIALTLKHNTIFEYIILQTFKVQLQLKTLTEGTDISGSKINFPKPQHKLKTAINKCSC